MEKRYVYDYDIKTRYAEYDHRDELKLSAWLTYLQEAGSGGAEQLGCGSDFLWKRGWGFIVTGYYLEIYRPVPITAPMKVKTWALPPKHVLFERSYEFLSESGEKIAAAESRWCLLDVKNGKILPADSIGKTDIADYRTDKALDFSAWKIGGKGDEGTPAFTTKVNLSDYDHYGHVNNTHYADFCMNCFTKEEWKRVSSFQIVYEKQCFIGDELRFYRSEIAPSRYLIEGKKEEITFMKAVIAF
jgi:acyl-ACP thioesterase